MKVLVKLYATFRNGRFNQEERVLAGGSAVSDVVLDLGIEEREVGMILCNHRHIDLSSLLADGDTLSIFPLVGGG